MKNIYKTKVSNILSVAFCLLFFGITNAQIAIDKLEVYGNAVNLTQQEIIDGGSYNGIYDGDLTLSSQAEVNEFHYTEVTGMLTISGADITDLTKLSSLVYVGKHVSEYYSYSMQICGNNSLTSLDGLQHLTTIAGGLVIRDNALLTTLGGLQNLNSLGSDRNIEDGFWLENEIHRSLQIENNTALLNLDGLEKITSVGGYIEIIGNGSMTNLNGLQYLTSVGEWISIINNASLVNIDGFPNLVTVNGYEIRAEHEDIVLERRGLNISGNTSMTNINGFNQLEYVGGDLSICQNNSLDHIDGFLELNSVRGGINISNNKVLNFLDGFNKLTSVAIYLTISGNDSLPNLGGFLSLNEVGKNGDRDDFGRSLNISGNRVLGNVSGLQNLTTVGGNLVISNNDMLTNLHGLKNLNSVGTNGGFYYRYGNLEIYNNDALNNLDSLQNLTIVGRHLIVQDNDVLTNLNGLKNLTSVGYVNFPGDLHVNTNLALNDLYDFCGLHKLLSNNGLIGAFDVDNNGFDATKLQIIDGGPCTTIYNGDLTLFTQAEVNEFHYTEITGSLTIGGNETYSSNITNLTPLSSLTYVGGSLNIKKNDFLTNLDGFENLTFIGGGINIWNDIVLTNVDGLRNLNSFNGGLSIAGNVALNNIDGFEKITSVAGGLQISANQSLADVDGLKNLISVGAWLDISYNATITSLEGLNNLTSIGGDLEIHHNSSLTHFCGLYPLLSGSGFTGNYEIYENKANPTRYQLLVACSSTVKPITTINPPVSTNCDTWEVPVKVSGFSVIGAISLKLNFNVDGLIYSEVDINDKLIGTVHELNAGIFSLEYFGNPVTLSDNEILFTLHFKLTPNINGTPFNLTWSTIPGDCLYAGPGGDPGYTTIDDFSNLSEDIITDKLPVIVCPGNIVVENDKGICGAVVTYLTPVGIDNCPNPVTKQTEGLASGKVFPVGLTTNTFLVTDSQGNTAKCSFTVTVLDKQPPLVTGTLSTITVEGCGAGAAPAAVTSVAGLEALAGGIKINDACTVKSAIVVTSSDVSTGTCPIVVTRTYKVMDASSNSTNIIQVIKVADNTPPVITGNLSSTLIEGCGAESIPPAVTSVAALEALAGGIKINDACTIKSSLKVTSKDSYFGSNPLVVTRTYTIKDACNNSVTTTQIIKVADTTSPVITQISANPATLWPANNKMVAVVINYLATDNCSLAHVALSVTSNEPQSGKSPDWIILDNHHLLLRADRLGKGSGRIYTITITATDAKGNQSSQKVTVSVPHDQSRQVLKEVDGKTSESLNGLSAQAFPNPSNQYFTVTIHSNSQQSVTLSVTDVAGRLIEVKTNIAANSTLQLGKGYQPGTYFAEVIQGKEKISLKLIKQAD